MTLAPCVHALLLASGAPLFEPRNWGFLRWGGGVGWGGWGRSCSCSLHRSQFAIHGVDGDPFGYGMQRDIFDMSGRCKPLTTYRRFSENDFEGGGGSGGGGFHGGMDTGATTVRNSAEGARHGVVQSTSPTTVTWMTQLSVKSTANATSMAATHKGQGSTWLLFPCITAIAIATAIQNWSPKAYMRGLDLNESVINEIVRDCTFCNERLLSMAGRTGIDL